MSCFQASLSRSTRSTALLVSIALLAGNGLLSGCGHSDRGGRQNSTAPLNTGTLGPFDVVEVRVYGEPDLSGVYQISGDGGFEFPMIGRVQAAGRPKNQVEQDITERLRQGVLKNPFVTIILKEQRSKKITVLGAVQKPGTFDYRDPMSILEALSLAGGFSPLADKNDTVVTRAGKRFTVSVEKIAEGRAQQFFLQPGDTIHVPERLF